MTQRLKQHSAGVEDGLLLLTARLCLLPLVRVSAACCTALHCRQPAQCDTPPGGRAEAGGWRTLTTWPQLLALASSSAAPTAPPHSGSGRHSQQLPSPFEPLLRLLALSSRLTSLLLTSCVARPSHLCCEASPLSSDAGHPRRCDAGEGGRGRSPPRRPSQRPSSRLLLPGPQRPGRSPYSHPSHSPCSPSLPLIHSPPFPTAELPSHEVNDAPNIATVPAVRLRSTAASASCLLCRPFN